VLVGRAQRRPRPDDPVTPQESHEAGRDVAADDPRDRPGGPSSEPT
jgi:hypothetical protein